MKDTLVCGNCMSSALVVNEEGDLHLDLDSDLELEDLQTKQK